MAENIRIMIIDGPIPFKEIERIVSEDSMSPVVGAQSTFSGRVRADKIAGKKVHKIRYEHYLEMSEPGLRRIGESACRKYRVEAIYILHSEGDVPVSGISLFILVSSRHRKDAIEACSFVLEEIKNKAPIWGKEFFKDESFSWKQNMNV